jgi:hypothetical protein
LDGLSSQISLLAERIDTSNTADRPHVPPGPQPHESTGATFAAFAGDPIDVKVDTEPGTITGRLHTTMGQPVAGVVTVTSVDGRQVARTKADGTVGYTVSDLRPGTYILIVTAPGFRHEAARVTVNGFGAVRNFVVAGDAQFGRGVIPHGVRPRQAGAARCDGDRQRRERAAGGGGGFRHGRPL